MIPDFVGLPPRTETIPESRRGRSFDGADLVTALRIRGVDLEHVLLVLQRKFTLGTADACDICVSGKHISFSHALLERLDNRIRVTDLGSKNGLTFCGRKERQFWISPGDTFSIDETVFYALNEEMRVARPVVAEILGPQRTADIDDVMIAVVHGNRVLVLAEAGCDQEQLGHAIHNASLRRGHNFDMVGPAPSGEQLDPKRVERVKNGTMVLRLESGGKLDPAFVDALLEPAWNVRPIICARTVRDAIDSVTERLVDCTFHVRIAPLRERSGEVTTLLERSFVNCGAHLRFSDFTDENQAALRTYHWPGNLEELREAAGMLIRLAPYESERQAAAETGVPRSNIKRWLDNLKLTFPLVKSPTK